MRKKLGVIFGGVSCEHDISIITGVMTVNAASVRHDVVPIYIDGSGQWLTGKDFNKTDTFLCGIFGSSKSEKSGRTKDGKDRLKLKAKKVHLRPSSNWLYSDNGRPYKWLDAVVICNHGLNGEDGSLSGLLQLAGIPYAGSGVLASAVGMDKITQKRIFEHAGFTVTPFAAVEKWETENKLYDMVTRVGKLGFPLMLKPSNLGSSIGIVRANDYKELFDGLNQAFEWDERVLVEQALDGFTELNCAVLGAGARVVASEVEEPVLSDGGFLSFKDKYVRKDSGGSLRGSKDSAGTGSGVSGAITERRQLSKGATGRYLPARISAELREEVQDTAKAVFRLIGCSGVARVDFLLKDSKLYVNEINTVPGSLSSYLFAFDGMGFPLLIDKLLAAAFDVFEKKKKLKYTYDSNVLKAALGTGSKTV